MVVLILISWGISILSLLMAIHVHFLIKVLIPCFLFSMTIILIDVIARCVSDLHFPDDWWRWASFMYPPSIHMSLWERPTAYSDPLLIFNWIIWFLLLNYTSSLCILDINPLSDTWLANIFSPIFASSFCLSFLLLCRNFLILYSPICLFWLLLLMLLVLYPQNCCQDQCYCAFFLCVLPEVLWCSALHLSL